MFPNRMIAGALGLATMTAVLAFGSLVGAPHPPAVSVLAAR